MFFPPKNLTSCIRLPPRRHIDIETIPRGGETTYHGPGQLVAYPIVDLRNRSLGARAYVEGLEDALVATVGAFGVQARGRVPGRTGVWVGSRKVAAIGVKISQGVTSHGIALNVDLDLEPFKWIVPCGVPDDDVVTSLARELRHVRRNAPPPLAAVKARFADAFAAQFGYAEAELREQSVS